MQSEVVSRESGDESIAGSGSVLGVWRVGKLLHQTETTVLALAQPAESVGGGRWDYVIKFASRRDAEARRQIRQFMAAATSVVQPNVIPVLDASLTKSTPYLVMPRIEGKTMRWHIESTIKPLPLVLWLVRQVAEALNAVHHAGWVHGDVKPENVMVDTGGHVTLVDFGFASRKYAMPNRVYRGTPEYSSPESLDSETPIMPAMDIFSLGMVLNRWLDAIEPVSALQLDPARGLAEQMISPNAGQRPIAVVVARQLLRLEIETLRYYGNDQEENRAA